LTTAKLEKVVAFGCSTIFILLETPINQCNDFRVTEKEKCQYSVIHEMVQ